MDDNNLRDKYDLSEEPTQEVLDEFSLHHKLISTEYLIKEYASLLSESERNPSTFNIEAISALITQNNNNILNLLGYDRKHRKHKK
jgi:hypothetical protein